jgi:spherulation-specific family 4 protein
MENGLADPITDVTVVFEGPYSDLQTKSTSLAALSGKRSEYAYVVHSVPSGTSLSTLTSSVSDSSQHAGYLFYTDLSSNYYESFGSDWNSFIQLLVS